MSDTAAQAAVKDAKNNPLLYFALLLMLGGQGTEFFTNDNVVREIQLMNDKLDDLSDALDTNTYRITLLERDLEDLDERLDKLEEE